MATRCKRGTPGDKTLRGVGITVEFPPLRLEISSEKPYCASPFKDLNRFRYHDNWLRNFLIASSLNGKNTAKPSKLKTR
jgi:hypothetical protein